MNKIKLSAKKGKQKLQRAFTLVEMILVIAVLAVLMLLVSQAFQSGSPLQASVVEMKAVLEAARATAIRDQTEVYVAFTDNGPTDLEDQFSHYAVFRRDKPNRSGEGSTYDLYFSNQLGNNELVLEKEWSRLPDGVVFGTSGEVPGLPGSMMERYTTGVTYKRSFDVPKRFGSSLMSLPFMMFNKEGRVQYPQFFEPQRLFLPLVEGFVESGSSGSVIRPLNKQSNPNGGADIARSETLGLNLYSGRVRIVSQNR